jgi:hypothetical protein
VEHGKTKTLLETEEVEHLKTFYELLQGEHETIHPPSSLSTNILAIGICDIGDCVEYMKSTFEHKILKKSGNAKTGQKPHGGCAMSVDGSRQPRRAPAVFQTGGD